MPRATAKPAAPADDPDDLPPSVVGIQKTATEAEVNAGDSFSYQLTPSCSGLTTGCVGMTVTDVIPEDLVVDEQALLAQSNPPDYTISYDEATRTVTVVYGAALTNPANTTGWPAGSPAPQITIPVTVPENTSLPSGEPVRNTASNVADNAPEVTDTADVTVIVPRVVKPTVTKDWADGSAVAGSGEASTVTLTVKNQSSSSTEVDELSVGDDTAATFENFDVTGVTVTAFPAGADTATLTVTLADGSTAQAVVTAPAPGEFVLPAGVEASDVVGYTVAFTNSDGTALPYDATGGTVEVGMVLRDTKRSDGSPLRPTDKVTVDNCATPSAHDTVLGTVSGTDGCDTYDILPDILVLNGVKGFFPDTNGNWQQDPGEHAVIDQDSPVTATVNVQNQSPFPVKQIVIEEPDPNTTTELNKIDIEQVRLRFPGGATTGVLDVRCTDGSTHSETYTANTTVDVSALCPSGVASVKVTYSGVDADGNPTIAPDATAGLDLHGPLNDNVTMEDLPGGTSAGIHNCAAYTGDAGRRDGSGTASGSTCKDLQIEEPVYGGTGTKSVGQTSIPPGQPIPFHIEVSNNGNVPIVDPVVSDPRVGVDGKPDPAYQNPFEYLRITNVTASITPSGIPLTVELYDPTTETWVPYDAGDAALLDRATGFRVVATGAVPPLGKITIDVTTERRDGAPDDLSFDNCISTGVIEFPDLGDPYCSPVMETGPANASASLNKSISPGELPRHVPGVPPQYATVDLTIANTGNLSAKELQVTDQDDDFFDAVDFVAFTGVTFPAGADRVRIDAYANGAWVDGTPATSAALPAGVAAGDVTGIRATFSSTNTANEGYVITPCATPATCAGHVTFQVSPREDLRSAPGTPIPEHLEDTVDGEFTTLLHPEGQVIAPNDATLDIVEGSPRLAVDKGPDSEIAPGQSTLFNLTVTNTGTNYVHDLTVEDVLPPGMAFDATFAGDDGQPYKITGVQVPDGTPALPTPEFTMTNDGDRVSELAFDFGTQANGDPFLFAPGSTFTIQIRVGLEPGVTAGQTITNTMGATGSDDDLACDGASDPDDVFGGGTWCTDTANLTTQSGASFTARKWVSGRDSLGWYDVQSGQHVAAGSTSCPSLDHGGRHFTSYPCIALVDPGDTFTYLLRLQNAGTEPGRDMRIVDRFPVVGDKGVFVDQDRETEWANRPTLASEPVLDGPGTMTTSYSDSEPLCTDDLKMGGVGGTASQCPESAWDDPFGPDAVGARMDLHFDPFIQPGGTVDITFDMTTPLQVPRVSDPTVAWNSFAHAEVTDRAGTPNVLPITEPVKVGVATAYGSLVLDKAIGENPDDLPLADLKFPIHAVCTIDPQGGVRQTVLDEVYQIAASDDPVRVDGIPAGATCTVSEVDALGGVLPAPQTVTIEPTFGSDEQVRTVTVTNNFPDAIIELTKTVTGAGADFGEDSYPVDLYCTFRGEPVEGYNPLHVELRPDEPRYQADVPAGSQCHAVETDSGGATTVTYDPPGDSDGSGDVTTAAGDPQAITITNDYAVGGIVVNKEVTGAGAPELAQGPFTFHVACTFDGEENAFEKDVTIPEGDGTQTTFTSPLVDGIPAGPADDPTTCVVSETDNGGADSTPSPVEVTIVPGEDVVAQFTADDGRANPFSAGTIGLAKKVEGPLADASWVQDETFVVQVTCQLDTTDEDGHPVRATLFSAPVEIGAGETIDALTGPDDQPLKLPVGTHCFGEEVEAGGATSHTVDHDSFEDAVVVEKQENPDEPQALMLTATNVFEATSVAVTKKVDGAGASGVGSTEFTIAVSCTLDQGYDEPTPVLTAEKHTIAAGRTVTIGDLPVGAHCWAEETDDGGAASSSVDHGTADDAVVLAADHTATITVTNTFDAPPSPPGGGLAFTGATVLPYAVAALGTVLVGLALLLVARRRRGTDPTS